MEGHKLLRVIKHVGLWQDRPGPFGRFFIGVAKEVNKGGTVLDYKLDGQPIAVFSTRAGAEEALRAASKADPGDNDEYTITEIADSDNGDTDDGDNSEEPGY